MSLIADLIVILLVDTPVTNLCVTNRKSGRKAIRPGKLHEDDVLTTQLGGLALEQSGNDFLSALDEQGDESMSDVSIECIATSALVANNLANAVQAALGDFKGATATGKIEAVDLTNRSEGWETAEDGREAGRYVTTLDLSIFYRAGT